MNCKDVLEIALTAFFCAVCLGGCAVIAFVCVYACASLYRYIRENLGVDE